MTIVRSQANLDQLRILGNGINTRTYVDATVGTAGSGSPLSTNGAIDFTTAQTVGGGVTEIDFDGGEIEPNSSLVTVGFIIGNGASATDRNEFNINNCLVEFLASANQSATEMMQNHTSLIANGATFLLLAGDGGNHQWPGFNPPAGEGYRMTIPNCVFANNGNGTLTNHFERLDPTFTHNFENVVFQNGAIYTGIDNIPFIGIRFSEDTAADASQTGFNATRVRMLPINNVPQQTLVWDMFLRCNFEQWGTRTNTTSDFSIGNSTNDNLRHIFFTDSTFGTGLSDNSLHIIQRAADVAAGRAIRFYHGQSWNPIFTNSTAGDTPVTDIKLLGTQPLWIGQADSDLNNLPTNNIVNRAAGTMTSVMLYGAARNVRLPGLMIERASVLAGNTSVDLPIDTAVADVNFWSYEANCFDLTTTSPTFRQVRSVTPAQSFMDTRFHLSTDAATEVLTTTPIPGEAAMLNNIGFTAAESLAANGITNFDDIFAAYKYHLWDSEATELQMYPVTGGIHSEYNVTFSGNAATATDNTTNTITVGGVLVANADNVLNGGTLYPQVSVANGRSLSFMDSIQPNNMSILVNPRGRSEAQWAAATAAEIRDTPGVTLTAVGENLSVSGFIHLNTVQVDAGFNVAAFSTIALNSTLTGTYDIETAWPDHVINTDGSVPGSRINLYHEGPLTVRVRNGESNRFTARGGVTIVENDAPPHTVRLAGSIDEIRGRGGFVAVRNATAGNYIFNQGANEQIHQITPTTTLADVSFSIPAGATDTYRLYYQPTNVLPTQTTTPTVYEMQIHTVSTTEDSQVAAIEVSSIITDAAQPLPTGYTPVIQLGDSTETVTPGVTLNSNSPIRVVLPVDVDIQNTAQTQTLMMVIASTRQYFETHTVNDYTDRLIEYELNQASRTNRPGNSLYFAASTTGTFAQRLLYSVSMTGFISRYRSGIPEVNTVPSQTASLSDIVAALDTSNTANIVTENNTRIRQLQSNEKTKPGPLKGSVTFNPAP